MRRREFVTLVSSAVAWPFTARAQQAATKQRIAIFHPAIPITLLTEKADEVVMTFKVVNIIAKRSPES